MDKSTDRIILQPLNPCAEKDFEKTLKNAKGLLNIMPNTEVNEHINKIVLTDTYYLDEIVKALLHERYVLTLERRDDNMTKITWKDK